MGGRYPISSLPSYRFIPTDLSSWAGPDLQLGENHQGQNAEGSYDFECPIQLPPNENSGWRNGPSQTIPIAFIWHALCYSNLVHIYSRELSLTSPPRLDVGQAGSRFRGWRPDALTRCHLERIDDHPAFHSFMRLVPRLTAGWFSPLWRQLLSRRGLEGRPRCRLYPAARQARA